MKKFILIPLLIVATTVNAGPPSKSKVQDRFKQHSTQQQSDSAYEEAETIYQLGEDYFSARNGKQQDYAMAAELFEKAANMGHATAQNDTGFIYQYALGREEDMEKALYWYKRSADQGNMVAMNNLGYLYDLGLTSKGEDKPAAIKWYARAAEQDYATAQYNLADLYHSEGEYQDLKLAHKYYEMAAELDHAPSMNRLGVMYYRGEGVEENYQIAVEWLTKAFLLGDEDARDNLEAIGEL